ncbi:helix-turn-helix domain-containing protein [Vibrio chagasii]|uniref:winged helix-turn-helix domain-containing protein n=1 Tax=Vibrio chagasii TaxID=170679 RepID=UPI0038CD674E
MTLLHSVPLSTIEFNILRVLYENSFKACTRQQLKKAGWPDRVVGPNSLNVCIMHLRKKLKSIIPDSEIRVVPSYGYKLLISKSIQLMDESELPSRKFYASAQRVQAASSNSSAALSTESKAKQTRQPSTITSCRDSQKSLRWEDLLLTACIWLYALTLYNSIYN